MNVKMNKKKQAFRHWLALPIGKLFRFGISFSFALVLWLNSLQYIFCPTPSAYNVKQGISPMARQLAKRHIQYWKDKKQNDKEKQILRQSNPEWDLLGRSFVVWSFANMGFHEPNRRSYYLKWIDTIIDDTIKLEKEKGTQHFSMSYLNNGAFVIQPARSIFLDGEIALMLGMRRLLQEKLKYKHEMLSRIKIMHERMEKSPVLSAESYPNEAWLFCNSIALAAMKLSDKLDGNNHNNFFKRWLKMAKSKLINRKTGLLVSAYDLQGNVSHGPEGSTLWMALHCLKIVYPEFAKQQYKKAKKALARKFVGFGYAIEWPNKAKGKIDIDSGPIIPFFKVSPSSSGLALIGASTFHDIQYIKSLLTTLQFAAFPSKKNGVLRFNASSQVGDAVLLYALTHGPIWNKILAKQQHSRNGGS